MSPASLSTNVNFSNFYYSVVTNLNIHYYLKIHFVNLNFATDKGKPGLCLHSLGALCLLKCKISQQTNYKLHFAE